MYFKYQYKCPQLVITGSLAVSKQMLHSNYELLFYYYWF
jgi:hypothetical protein